MLLIDKMGRILVPLIVQMAAERDPEAFEIGVLFCRLCLRRLRLLLLLGLDWLCLCGARGHLLRREGRGVRC